MANLIKRNGQLVEDTDGTLKDRVEKLSLGQSPTSAIAAQKLGATPKAVDMAGSQAHKDAVVREAAAPKEQTLEGAQRLQPQYQPRESDQEAQERAQQIQQFGSLGSRVQSKIEQLVQAAPGAVEDAALVLDESLLPAELDLEATTPTGTIRSDYNAYLANPTEEGFAALMSAAKEQGVDTINIAQSLQRAGVVTADQAAAAIQDSFTMADLASGAELAQMEQMFPGATSMTVPQFEEALKQLQAEEFDRVAELRAEMAALPPGSARAEILQREMAALGAVGATGAEELVDRAVESIEMADSIIIGDKEWTIEEFLKDDNLSQMVEDYLVDPDNPDHPFNTDPAYDALKTWAIENKKAVEDLGDAAKATAAEQKVAQETWTKWGDEYSGFMERFGFDPDAAATSETVEAMTKRMQWSAIGQLILATQGEDGADAIAALGKLEDVDPNELHRYRSADSLLDAMAVTEAAIDMGLLEPGVALADYNRIGELKHRSGMIKAGEAVFGENSKSMSPAMLAFAADATPEVQAMLKDAAVYESFRDPFVQRLVMNGMIDRDNIEVLADSAAQIKEAYNDWKEQPGGQSGASTQDIMEEVFAGEDVPRQQEILELMDEAEEAAELGSKNAANAVEVYKKLLSGGYTSGSTSLHDFLTGGGNNTDAAVAELIDVFRGEGSYFDDNLPTNFPSTFRDDVAAGITTQTLAGYEPHQVEALYDSEYADKLPPYDSYVEKTLYSGGSGVGADTLNAVKGILQMSDWGVENLSDADYNTYANAIKAVAHGAPESVIKDVLGLDQTSKLSKAMSTKLQEDAREALDILVHEGNRRYEIAEAERQVVAKQEAWDEYWKYKQGEKDDIEARLDEIRQQSTWGNLPIYELKALKEEQAALEKKRDAIDNNAPENPQG